MKKVLLAFDGSNFSEGAFRFVQLLNDIEPVFLTAAFTPQVDYSSLWSYATAAEGGVGIPLIPLYEEESAETVQKNIVHFEELCRKSGITFRVHKDFYDFALPELRKETRFSDVAVLSSETFYKGVTGSDRFEYLKDALHASECPVVLVPEQFTFPQTNILAYDGSQESVYAIKQFAYVFPELAKNETLLVYADSDRDKDFPERHEITELVAQHYKNLQFQRLEANAKKFFATWVGEKEGAIVICGSFGRSSISESFKRSFITDIINDHKLPVFIAHK
jgi:hypothetical protein